MQYPTLKQALELRPYSPGQMAAVGGGLAGLTGVGIGALSGDTPEERRKKMITYGLLGLGTGAGFGAISSANARAGIASPVALAKTPGLLAMMAQQTQRLGGEGAEKGLKIMTDQSKDITMAAQEAASDRIKGILGQVKVPALDALGRLVSPDPVADTLASAEQLAKLEGKAKSDSDTAWDLMKKFKIYTDKK
jgi:hypothetical protein